MVEKDDGNSRWDNDELTVADGIALDNGLEGWRGAGMGALGVNRLFRPPSLNSFLARSRYFM